MTTRRSLLPVTLFFGINLIPISSATSAVWPMLGGSVRHPSASTFLGPATNVLAWRFPTNGAIDGGVAIDSDGTVYFGAANGRFHAIEQSGQERWSQKSLSPVVGVPAIGHDGRVYVGANSGTAGTLYAFDRRSGAGGLIFTAESPLVGSPAIDQDGTILLATRSKGVFAVSPMGDLLWRSAIGRIERSSVAVGADGAVYVGTADGRIVALEPDGRERWSSVIARKTTILTTPAIGGVGRIYVGADDGIVRALDSAGTLLWGFAARGAVRSGVSVGPDGTVYFGADDGKVYRLADTGILLWATLLGGAVRSTPVIDRSGAVYVGADDQRIHSLEADGSARWSFPTGAPVRSALALGIGGRLFAGSNDRILYAIGEFRVGPDCWSNAFIDPDGLTEEEADRRLQILLAACGGPDVDSCEAQVQGAVNADRVAAAHRMMGKAIDPAEYLALLRDRTTKLSALRKGTGVGLCEVAAGDQDGDFVPDGRDLCPGTTPLTPTLEGGCPDPFRPEAPSAELVHRFLDSFGLAFDPHCNDTFPATSIFLGLSPVFLDELNGTFSFSIIVTDSNDLPPECGSWYEIQAFIPTASGAFREFYMVFPRSRAQTNPTAPGRLGFRVSSDDPEPYRAFAESLPLDPAARDQIRMRLRVTTFRGFRSEWGSM